MHTSMTENEIPAFKDIVWDFYAQHPRQLPWRQVNDDGTLDPYCVLVSEMMLQQTQVQRVIPKYSTFLQSFPDISSLATAPLGDVLQAWSGLGYNRRAKYLWQSARTLASEPRQGFPNSIEELVKLPGIGPNTAAAILTYSYNRPHIFIETNIRTIYIYHFFPEEERVSDAALLQLVASTVDEENPREWYWALMDYGSWLKKTVGNYAQYSKQYVKQSRFEGSDRQIRGKILKMLGQRSYQKSEMFEALQDTRSERIINALIFEGLVKSNGSQINLP
jgi:A/G-specific adenine glycosylase